MNLGPDADEQVYEHPDDPYTVTTRWDDDGFHVIVTADILDGEDGTEVRAEAQRRADEILALLASTLHPYTAP